MGQLQITPDGYREIKENIRTKLNETADNFVAIGYYLKQVRDSMLYEMDGYGSMAEFAQKEYGISQSTASRFMDINTKFSRDGNSLEISEQYRGYGASKLQEMLTMSEEDMELVTPETTVRQIKEIKEAERAERQQEEQEAAMHLPIVEMARGEEEPEETYATSHESDAALSPIEQTVLALFESKPEEWRSRVLNGFFTDKDMAEQLSPSGSRTFTHGVHMLFLYKYEIGSKFRYYKDGKAQVESYTYADLLAMMQRLGQNTVFDAMNPPEETVQEEPVQEETVQEEPRVRTWVTPEVLENPAGQQEGYEPLPGQTTLNEQGEVTETTEDEPEKVTAEVEPRQQGYAPIEIANAKGYFEMEIERMTNMGGATRDSIRCRNYKIALEAIRGYFGV